MFLNKEIAGKIIEEVSKVVDYNINIMDEQGLILASTNPERLNTFHEGAFLTISQNLKELKVYKAEEYAGCQEGINLPIVLDKKIIGVIGITGEVDEVILYGKVIKKMTEILVENLSAKEQHNIMEQSKLLFINEWVSGELESRHAYFEQNAKQYGIDMNSGFTMAVFKILPKEPGDYLDYREIGKVISFINENLNQKKMLFSSNSNTGFVISSGTDDTHLLQKLIHLSEKISAHFPCYVIGGVGCTYPEYRDLPKSYGEAMKVMNYYLGADPGIYCYDDNIISLMLDEIPQVYKNQCILQIFAGCTQKEIIDFSDFIIAYYENSGSINKIGEQLYIHKNTVQYKINKILTRTGLDLRIHQDMLALLLAAHFHKGFH